jgi:hypothetical protein
MVEEPFGSFVIQSETGEPGVNGTRVYEPRTRIRTYRTVWERYRLIAKYDTSNQFNFGRNDADSLAILKAATVSIARTQYIISGWSGATGQSNSITMKGLRPGETLPTTPAEFDTMWAASGSSTTMGTGTSAVNILSWLPTATANSVHLLFFSDTEKRGLNPVSGQMRIWDRTPITLPATPYDWTQHWIREDYNEWRTIALLPGDNYQISLGDLLPSGFWNVAGRELEVSLVFIDEFGVDTDLAAKQRFFVSIGDPLAEGSPNREWRIRSDGHWGVVDHAINVSSRTGFPLDGFSMFPGGWGPIIKIRGSVYELLGDANLSLTSGRQAGRRQEGGVLAYYKWVPYWRQGSQYYYNESTGTPRYYLRIKITSDNPQQNIYGQTGLRHDRDEKNLTCPANYTCPIIDDYAHPEWRVTSHALTGLNETRVPAEYSHDGCTVTAATSQRTIDITIDYTTYLWSVTWTATYEPSSRTVYFPLVVQMDGYIANTTSDPVTWPGGRGEAATGPSPLFTTGFVNKLTNGFYALPVHTYDWDGPTVEDATCYFFGAVNVLTPGLPEFTIADKTPQEVISGRAIHATGEWDTTNSSNYSVVIEVNEAYTSSTVSGLPPWIASSGGNIRVNENLLVATGLGEGLVFKCTGLISFVDGEPVFTFEAVSQYFVPVLESLPSTEDLSNLESAIPIFIYWIEFSGFFYPITAGVVGDPVAELPALIPTQELVDVRMMYSPFCYIAGGEDDSEIYEEDFIGVLISSTPSYVGEPALDAPPADIIFPLTVSAPWDGVPAVTPDTQPIFTITVAYVPFTGGTSWAIGSNGYDWNRRYITSYTIGEEIFTVTNLGESGDPPYDRDYTHTQFFLGPEFDFIWHILSVVRAGTFSSRSHRISPDNVSGAPAPYASPITIEMVKQVARWKDRMLPTLTFQGTEALQNVDFGSESVIENAFWKVNGIGVSNLEYTYPLGIFDDPPPEDHVRVNFTRARVYLDNLTITIAPSTYVPPAPL